MKGGGRTHNAAQHLSHDRLAALFDAAPLGIYHTDARGRLTSVNQCMAELLGYPDPATLLKEAGNTFVDLFFEKSEYAAIKDAFAEGRSLSGHECRLLKRGGECVWVSLSTRPVTDETGAVTGADGFCIDITPVKTTQANAKRNEERYRRLVSNASDGFFLYDMQGDILDVNSAACALLGYSREELVSLNLRDLYVGGDVSAVLHSWRVAADGWSSATSRTLQCKDGETVTVEIHASIFDEDDRRFALELARSDATQEAVQKELIRARDAAEEANRAKSQFLANMSHEIRTPLSGVLGLLDVTLDTDLTPQQQEYLLMTKDSAHSLLQVINDILDFSKIEAGKLDIQPEEFILQDSMRRALRPISLQCGDKGLGYTALVEPNVPQRLIGDPGRLGQVLINLAGNAIKFTDRGEISITVKLYKPLEEGEPVSLLFSVKDTGKGISKEDQEKLFHSFSQVDGSLSRRFGGSGLGLAICKQLVIMMGGDIWVESEAGKGSEFFFTARFKDWDFQTRGDDAPVQSADDEMRLPNLRILLAEDNAVNRLFISRLLTERGHVVELAIDGDEALTLLEHGTYDIVLMDIQMPGLDGQEVTEAIREGSGPNADIPIIALTAHAMKGDRERFIEAGMNDYVSKPVHIEKLLHSIASVLMETGKLEEIVAPDDTAMAPEKEAVVLDADSLNTLFKDNRPILGQMLMLFLQDAPLRKEAIAKCIAAGDLVRTGEALHSLTNTAGTLKAARLAKLASHMEELARTGNSDGLQAHLEQFDLELESALQAVRGLKESL